MKKQQLTQKEFDGLLAWLDADPERAGEKYESVRRGLIDMFVYRGCNDAEELADETINRVARKVEEIAPTYEGDPRRYFYGVAKRLHQEYLKERPPAAWSPPAPMSEERERRLACLDRCIEPLTPENHELILLSYRDQKKAKIDTRKELCARLNMTSTALRVRVHRLRDQLEKCVRRCLGEADGGNESDGMS